MSKKRIIIIIAILVIIALISIPIINQSKAKAAVAEYVETYEDKLAAGDYDAIRTEAMDLLAEHENYLSDEEKNELNTRADYAFLLNELDFRHTFPSEEPNISEIVAFEDNYTYGVSKSLVDFIDTYQFEAGSIEGTVTVPPKSDKNSKDDSVSEVVGDSIITTTGWGGSIPTTDSSSSGESEWFGGDGSDNDGASEQKEKEEKPKEYPCEGNVYLGFDKIDDSGKVSEDNMKKAFALSISLSDEVKDEIICTEFEGIIYEDELSGFTIEGKTDKSVTAKGSFDGSTWKLDFGNDITATLKKPKKTSYSSSSGSSNTNKDYSPGSEWEEYDKDKDGRISDDEFQDSVNDYMDDYFDNYDSDYSPGSEWEQYDSDYNGKIDDNEFQDSVNDWMDNNGY